MKCMDTALSPLKPSGMRILNYLDDWLVFLAQSGSALLSDKLRILAHIQSLGLTVNMQKSILVPGARTSPFRSRAELNQYARASVGGALTKTYQLSRSLWLLHMRPLQLCIKSQVPQNALRTGTLRIKMTRGCLHTLIPWRNMTLYRRGVRIGQVIRRTNVTTDASSRGAAEPYATADQPSGHGQK